SRPESLLPGPRLVRAHAFGADVGVRADGAPFPVSAGTERVPPWLGHGPDALLHQPPGGPVAHLPDAAAGDGAVRLGHGAPLAGARPVAADAPAVLRDPGGRRRLRVLDPPHVPHRAAAVALPRGAPLGREHGLDRRL